MRAPVNRRPSGAADWRPCEIPLVVGPRKVCYCFLLLQMGNPGQVHITGPVPEDHSREACFKAYVAVDAMVSSREDGTELIQCEYDSEESEVTFHDRWAGTFAKPLNIQAVVLQLVKQYLPGESFPDPRTAIPGLRHVKIHFYEADSTRPAATISFGRNAYDKAGPLLHHLWKIRPGIEEEWFRAMKRRHAVVMSDQEYRTIADSVAHRIYALYEDVWVEVSPMARIEMHKHCLSRLLITPESTFLAVSDSVRVGLRPGRSKAT